MSNKHFLHISDYSKEELWDILELSKVVKAKFHRREDHKVFHNKSLAMIFAKPSARTRVSFETGFEWMGGHALFLGPNDIGIGKREAIKDISRVFSRYNDIVMARLFDHEHIIELAKHSTVPIVNGLTDYNHPCQIMADIFTVWEHLSNGIECIFNASELLQTVFSFGLNFSQTGPLTIKTSHCLGDWRIKCRFPRFICNSFNVVVFHQTNGGPVNITRLVSHLLRTAIISETVILSHLLKSVSHQEH